MIELAVRPPLDGDSGSGPLVVLVHGAMDRAANFEAVRRALRGLAVISYDRRGYGGSAHLGTADRISRHAADLIELLETTARGPAIVVGHSFGGLVAVGAAGHAPHLIAAVGAYEPPMPWTPWWEASPPFTSPETATEEFFERMVGPGVFAGLPPEFREDRRAEGAALIADYAAAEAGLDIEVADLLCPLAAAHGSRTLPKFERAATTLVEAAHDATLTIIAGASHGAHMTHPEAFADWIRSTVVPSAPG